MDAVHQRGKIMDAMCMRGKGMDAVPLWGKGMMQCVCGGGSWIGAYAGACWTDCMLGWAHFELQVWLHAC